MRLSQILGTAILAGSIALGGCEESDREKAQKEALREHIGARVPDHSFGDGLEKKLEQHGCQQMHEVYALHDVYPDATTYRYDVNGREITIIHCETPPYPGGSTVAIVDTAFQARDSDGLDIHQPFARDGLASKDAFVGAQLRSPFMAMAVSMFLGDELPDYGDFFSRYEERFKNIEKQFPEGISFEEYLAQRLDREHRIQVVPIQDVQNAGLMKYPQEAAYFASRGSLFDYSKEWMIHDSIVGMMFDQDEEQMLQISKDITRLRFATREELVDPDFSCLEERRMRVYEYDIPDDTFTVVYDLDVTPRIYCAEPR